MARPRKCGCEPTPENTYWRNGKSDGCLTHKLRYISKYREDNREEIRRRDREGKKLKRTATT